MNHEFGKFHSKSLNISMWELSTTISMKSFQASKFRQTPNMGPIHFKPVKASYTPQTPPKASNRLYGGLGFQFLFENALGSPPMHHFPICRNFQKWQEILPFCIAPLFA